MAERARTVKLRIMPSKKAAPRGGRSRSANSANNKLQKRSTANAKPARGQTASQPRRSHRRTQQRQPQDDDDEDDEDAEESDSEEEVDVETDDELEAEINA